MDKRAGLVVVFRDEGGALVFHNEEDTLRLDFDEKYLMIFDGNILIAIFPDDLWQYARFMDKDEMEEMAGEKRT